MKSTLIPIEKIENKIFLIRGKRVMLDKDLAELYDVETRALIQAVKRNSDRFPEDFMFNLNEQEYEILRSQIVISSWGGRRHLPYAFTEQGVSMLSSVLNSKRAIHVNIQIMRIFTRLREVIASNKEIMEKLNQLENKVEKHDSEIQSIFEAIRQLIATPERTKKKIGFSTN